MTPLPQGACLLVTAAGTATGYGVIRTARDRFGDRIRIVATDTNPQALVAAAPLVDQFYRVPAIKEPTFTDQLLTVITDQQVSLYWPLLDPEIVLAAELAGQRRLPEGTAVIAPTASTARLCFDKLALADWLRQSGLPTPSTLPFEEAGFQGRPSFVKPRYGWGSVGATRVETAEQWATCAESGAELVVQEPCSPPEVTVDCFRSLDGGMVRAISRERLEVKAGVSTKARIYEDQATGALARRLAEGLCLSGTSCFQTMLTATGEQVVTDVNPRPGGGTRLTVAAGVDLLSASLLDRVGSDLGSCLPALDGEHFVVRHWEEVVTCSRGQGGRLASTAPAVES